jgi:peptidoglycan/xylan/chitin deacetylase (PgdA/CDA1 family)
VTRPRRPNRRRRLRVALCLVAVLAVAAGVTAREVWQDRPNLIPITVVRGGVTHPVRVEEPATIGDALEEAQVVPRPGRLLSAVTGTVLDPALHPVRLLIDGLPATDESLLLAYNTIDVVEPEDETEPTVDGEDVLPAPSMPTVVRSLWHPGQPGRALNRKGAISGEVVAQVEVQPPASPAPVTEKLVALTFDDGPGAATPEVLRILREKNVKATFCVVSRQLRKEGLAMATAAMGEGHHLCNHTVNHDAGLPGKSQKVIDDEIRGANRQLVERTGVKPAFYRPPAGKMGSKIEATVKDEGQQVLLWSVDTKDFQKPPPEAIVTAVMANVQPGGIVLLHDGGGDRNTTLAALPHIIDQLQAAGYTLVLPDAVPPVPAAAVTAATLPA